MADDNTTIVPSHELTDVTVRPVIFMAAAVGGMIALALVLCLGWFHFFFTRAEPLPAASDIPGPPPGPQIQIDPAAELQQLRMLEDEKLNSYGWVDRGSGKVRIPIERAMDLQLERGFPTRKEGAKK